MHFTQNAVICDDRGMFILIYNILITYIKNTMHPLQKTHAQHRPDVYLCRVFVEAWLSNNSSSWTLENVRAR